MDQPPLNEETFNESVVVENTPNKNVLVENTVGGNAFDENALDDDAPNEEYVGDAPWDDMEDLTESEFEQWQNIDGQRLSAGIIMLGLKSKGSIPTSDEYDEICENITPDDVRTILKLKPHVVLTILDVLRQRMHKRQFDFATLPHYSYSELKQSDDFRTINLLPGGVNDIIRCHIERHPLSACPQYEALSYCWGKDPTYRKIIVDDGAATYQFEVSMQLHFALLRLRHHEEPRMLWIDAICINQKDDDEKTFQVAMMRDIYCRASRVVVWLGEEYDNSTAALQLTSQAYVIRNKILSDMENKGSDVLSQKWDIAGPHEQIWNDLKQLLWRPWFQRAWIIQEIALATKLVILCGDHEMEWKEFIRGLQCATILGWDNSSSYSIASERASNIDKQRNDYQNGRNQSSLAILIEHQNSKATDPRDHIFAYHGLFQPGSPDHAMTRPDYRASCIEAFQNWTEASIAETATLDTFTVPRSYTVPPRAGLPTWVPNWCGEWHGEPFLKRLWYSKYDAVPYFRATYQATGSSSCQLVVDNGKLKLEGWIIDTVTASGLLNNQKMDFADVVTGQWTTEHILTEHKIYQSWEQTARLPFGRYWPTNESRIDAYWKTLAGGATLFPTAKEDRIAFLIWYASNLPYRALSTLGLGRASVLDACYNFGSVLHSVCQSLRINSLFRSICTFLRIDRIVPRRLKLPFDIFQKGHTFTTHRRVIRTVRGLIGLGPALVEKDDFLVLCRGGKLPLILRRRGQYWEFIGECYVHGLTDGKLWEMLEAGSGSGRLWRGFAYPPCQRSDFWLV